ncbi:MAG: DNA repair protein RecN [Porticoccaceae bacterium]|nr:DNA repair protein RecN [Porticoccaceae bacterium]
MLISLTVSHFTLVEHLDVEFHPGMTALTGETGAGKSLLLDALGMALGDRGDVARIRKGCDRAEVAATFAVETNPQAQQWLIDNGFASGDECLIRRVLTAEGRSRGFINGQPATMQQLQQLGDLMLDIHGQHEHQSLLKRDTHRRLLDLFADGGQQAELVARCYESWLKARRQLDELDNRREEFEARRSLLKFQVAELDALALEEGELASLEEEQYRLANAEQSLRESHRLLTLCREGEDGDLLSLLSRAIQVADGVEGKTSHLTEAADLLQSALIQVDEAAREIQRHIDSFEADPERLIQVEERLTTVYELARKHRTQPAQLPTLHADLTDELAELTDSDSAGDTLRQRVQELEQSLVAAEQQLSTLRADAANRFAAAVNEQLCELAMANADLTISLTPSEDHSSTGRENVEFLLRSNPGQPHRPLIKIASGGELSRISLAIQVVAARHTDIPTLVFDEVDVGIGGAVAEVVGRLLRELGSRGQVICVTHLPQVASCAHQHLVVSKHSDGDQTESALARLDDSQRVEEIARMLGGTKITAQTRAHAREMLSLSAG